MSILGTLFSGKAVEVGAGAIKKVGEIIDDATLSQQEKAQYTVEIIKAELGQDDKYTKWLRPTVGYMGLLLIAWNYAVVPFFGDPVTFPEMFWYAWGGVMSVYTMGRTFEKVVKK